MYWYASRSTAREHRQRLYIAFEWRTDTFIFYVAGERSNVIVPRIICEPEGVNLDFIFSGVQQQYNTTQKNETLYCTAHDVRRITTNFECMMYPFLLCLGRKILAPVGALFLPAADAPRTAVEFGWLCSSGFSPTARLATSRRRTRPSVAETNFSH